MVIQDSKPVYVPKNYIVQFSHKAEPTHLMLCKQIEDERYRFVDVKAGLIYNLCFNSVANAEFWVHTYSQIIEEL